MDETRARVAEMIKTTGISQAELARRITADGQYRVQPPEISTAISGTLTTPKANRILADCYSILEAERRKMNLAAHGLD